MKSFYIHSVPKWAPHLMGGGKSLQLVENPTEPLLLWLQTLNCRLSLVNLFRWLRELPNPRWSVGVGFLILSVSSFPLQAGIISTIAGSGPQAYGGDGGPATSAWLYSPSDVAIDSSGNVYIADAGNSRIRKVTGTTINTIAGSATMGFSGDAGTATSAQLSQPLAVVVDGSGNLYIADSNNNRIRKVTPGGTISTVAGDGTPGYGGDDGPAISAQLFHPTDVAIDSGGNLYIADFNNQCIRKVAAGTGTISTVAGTGTAGYNGDGIAATSAQLYRPYSVAVDSSGNLLYIADLNNYRIRKVTAGTISTVAGNGTVGYSGDGGSATSAQLSAYTKVAVDSSGNLYIADESNHRIRKVTSGGTIYTVAGTGTPGYSGDGGVSTSAQLLSPYGMAFDSSGNLYIADFFNQRIRKVIPSPFDQTITFTSPASGTYGGSATLSATATSALAVTLTNTTTGICTLSGMTVNYVGVGTCNLTANQEGDANYNAAIPVSKNITVTNTAPAANNGTLTTNEDTAGSGTLSASDADGNVLTYSIVTDGSKGSATITNASTGAYTYTPTANQNGSDSVTFKANDGLADSTPKTITVTITAVNDAPVITGQTSLNTNEDTAVTLTLNAVSVTDLDNLYPTGFSLLIQSGTNYTFSGNTLTPAANFNGTLTVPVKVNDGGLDSNLYNLTVTITPVNDPPTLTASNPPAVLENSGTQTLSGWATFNPGPNETDNVLTYTVSNVSNPTLFSSLPSVNTSGTLTYTLATNQSGTSTLTVTVQDTGGTANGGIDLSTASQFTLGVNAPELQVTQGTTVQANGSSYDFGAVLITQTSPVITFTIDNLGTADLSLTGTPKLAVTGEAAVDFKVVDQTTDTIVPGGRTTFTVTFVPTVTGLRSATLTLLNNDSDETLDTMVLQGQSLTPNIKVSQGSTEIPLGGSFDIGLVGIDHLVTYPFTIENVGNSDLRLTGGGTPLSLSGRSAGEFNVDTTATQSMLKAGEKTEFLLNLIPIEVGPKTVTLSLPNDDLEQGNYSFTVTAQGMVSKSLQVTLTGSGTGTVTSQLPNLQCVADLCEQPVIDAPQWVYLKALPDTGSTFVGWSGDPACQADGKVLILTDTICQATFELQSYEFTVGRLGHGKVTGPGIDCPSDCTETVLYGTELQLEATADREWIHTGWKGSCDATGKVQVTNARLCHAVFEADLQVPNLGDGNGDGTPDARQPNVISLPDKVVGNYVTFEVQPDTCPIDDVYTDLPDNYGNPDKNKPLPQGLIYFELGCAQAQISVYYHALSVVRRNFVFQKFGPKVPGDLNTLGWFTLPNVTFETVQVGDKTVVKATYTVTDGGLGDSTGVDGRIVDPGGIMVK